MLKHLRFKLFLIGCLLCANLMANSDYKVTASSLNVRASSSKNAQVIGSLKMNDVVSVIKIENEWAEIMYNNKQAYISAKYIVKVEVEVVNDKKGKTKSNNKPKIAKNKQKSGVEKTPKKSVPISCDWNKWGVDFMPSIALGVASFMGDYSPVPICALDIDLNIQSYQKFEDAPRGWLAEGAIGYALKGCGPMPVQYFMIRLSPAGYTHTLQKGVTLSGLLGVTFNIGGGSIYAYNSNVGKWYYANVFDLGMQLKFMAEWRKYAMAISYDQGFLDVINNSNLTFKNYGVYIHFGYRLWDIPNNKIYK